MYQKLETAVEYIRSHGKSSPPPRVGLILGSGWGAFVEDEIEGRGILSYSDIPFFKETTVEGHKGQLILGQFAGVEMAILQGRHHPYEGFPMEDIAFPLRTLGLLGIEHLILTNAAGAINLEFQKGDLAIIVDHINLMGTNPLVGPNMNRFGPRFPDMTETYDPAWRKALLQSAKELGITLREGVYAALLGPTYETPAEVNMLRLLGADMVGMSTVPEAIVANHFGLKVCGISCMANMAAGLDKRPLKHEDIKKEALKVMKKFTPLIKKAIEKIKLK